MKPGINKDVTEYMAEGGWVDCDWVRFRQGRPEKIGGFVSETVSHRNDALNTKFTGVARDIIAWNDLESKDYFVAGTHLKLEIFFENQIYDITPSRQSNAVTDAITTTSGLTTIDITDTSPHNVAIGDYIFVNSQATSPFNGVTLLGEYTVTSVSTANTFSIDTGQVASSSGTGGGVLDYEYLLEVGFQDTGSITGWSGSTWNTEGAAGQGWNRPRDGVGGIDLRNWSLDTWGEDLIANVRGGAIYQWDATTGADVRASLIANAPPNNNLILVAQPSRHLVSFGTNLISSGFFDPLVIRWASQETLTDWTPTALNTAGEFRLPKGNKIVGAVQTRGEIVIFTDSEVYSMRFVGGNEVFRITPLGTNVGAISQHCMIDVNGVIFWIGKDNFYMYDGVIKILNSTIDKYLFDQAGEGRINETQKEKLHAGINRRFHEIWWLYPRHDNSECSHYVVYNYLENLYYFGEVARTVWQEKGVFERPYAISPDGTLYSHEEGVDADGSPKEAFLQSAYFDLGDGEDQMFMDKILPDIKLVPNRGIEISVLIRNYPHPNAKIQTKGPYPFSDLDNKISMRARGRQMALLYTSTATGADFEIGKMRISVQPDGERE
tara:strand:- start:165 stop:1985 length:1821 start_codon:yes stop_codon:yes gene_type:complete